MKIIDGIYLILFNNQMWLEPEFTDEKTQLEVT